MAKKAKKEEVKVTQITDNSARLTAVKIAMQQIQKQFGEGAIMRMGVDKVSEKIPVISSGALSLDLALGVGGFPKGRIVEIYGPEASGKTTVALHVIAEAQKNGGVAAFIDAEHAMDPARAQSIGVDLDNLLLSQPDNGEQALEIAETLIRSGGVDVVVIDSVAALVPKSEIEGEMGDSSMGLQARLMSQALRKITGAISKSKCIVIFTNQLREKIGVMFGNPEVTTGGKALKFYASVRIDMRKIGNIQEGEEIIGSRHRAKIVKNKVAPPFKSTEVDILNVGGISRLGDLLDTAITYGVIDKAGAFLKYEGQTIAQGRESAKAYLAERPELMDKIRAQVMEKVHAPDKPAV
ncbi:MAG: RecA protein, recombination protein RecA [Candidatus Collierbacteria bacterium GW2011_GWC1_45_47]|uniref:Protein RecA n=4 Tax=Candidatus Collieribacteriota TaxID=1752725 RepID=A0A0G1HHN6_9BACT|nr:MAG: Protein RecA [Candidatus Collierbacteria bacterium GW2011_GWA1_44_12]KKT46430.1 MAG: Protein RecA [Candidatus Collierbacteria bacterium GW2011_GWF2_44_15]KKT68204.1 MAG: Protein RecA [Candidatus Collierbacteria bacterium GW2011_GWB1_44_35]KKU00425.1 MAG: Protein RecA [Candidatus Collierbacteria bacterium GW2011_GWC2_45_15]KKU09635.1 MAG: RecA protein, recombination protein RecA [Candidatus Collierbacteria bacterium GW2011_GWC1_45_47]